MSAGPLFLMFAAFESTRNWFWSWLSSTIGYLFTFVSVFIVWGFLLRLTSGYIYSFNVDDIFTWIDVSKSFFSCIFLGAVISRIGDLSSSWFGAGNITDGTDAVFAAMGYKSAKGAAKGAKDKVLIEKLIESLYKINVEPEDELENDIWRQ